MDSKIAGIPLVIWLFIVFVVGGIFGLTYVFEYRPEMQAIQSVQETENIKPKVVFITPTVATPSATPTVGAYKNYVPPTFVPTGSVK